MTTTQPGRATASSSTIADVVARVQPRQIESNSAVLLPFDESGAISYREFATHLEHTAAAGLRPCVNMDTGYVNLLTDDERRQVLEVTRGVMGGRSFVAGAFIEGKEGNALELYKREVATIQSYGGVPIIFQSTPLKSLSDEEIVTLYRQIAQESEQVIAFELGQMFASFGMIYNLSVVQGLMEIPQIIGMKHSSLSREQELLRLELRDRVRPDFKVYTGNDLAIDMIMYGSDYLLGISTFAPEKFAERDHLWTSSDPAFYELNDLLQYLGQFAFRAPTPAYKHSAAQFLHLCGRISTDKAHPRNPTRPDSDVAILREIAERLGLI